MFTQMAYSFCRKLLAISSVVQTVFAIRATAHPLATLRIHIIVTTSASPTDMTRCQPRLVAPTHRVLRGGVTITLVRTTW